jgi:hypothetical protein
MAPIQKVPGVLGPMPDWSGEGIGWWVSICQSALPAVSAWALSNSALGPAVAGAAISRAARSRGIE